MGCQSSTAITLSNPRMLLLLAGLGCITFSRCQAQWAVTYLDPDGASDSLTTSVSGGQQVGRARENRAALWTGTAASWVDLHPAGAVNSIAYGTSGGYQVGSALVGNQECASLWTGTAASWVNLGPNGASQSVAYGASASHQVVYSVVGDRVRASLWTGTAS